MKRLLRISLLVVPILAIFVIALVIKNDAVQARFDE